MPVKTPNLTVGVKNNCPVRDGKPDVRFSSRHREAVRGTVSIDCGLFSLLGIVSSFSLVFFIQFFLEELVLS